MNREQVKKVLDILKLNYPNYINDNNKSSMLEEWSKELENYSFNDTIERLKQVMCEEKYQMKPPTLYYITNGLTSLKYKINYDDSVHYCDICHRPFNNLEEMMNHRKRETSIEYMIRETKRWFNKNLDKETINKLYNLSDEEFKEKYYKLLHYIHDNTKDINEKTRIGFVFNPPSIEEAQNFFGNKVTQN